MKVVIMIGSIRSQRQSHKIAYYLRSKIQERGIDSEIIDLYPGPVEGSSHIDETLQEANSLIFVTPEYHGSFSGVLKVVLDNSQADLRRKPIGVVAVSSGRMGGVNAAAQLQHVVLSIGAFALPGRLLVSDVETSFDESFQLTNERTVRAAKKFLDEYLWFTAAICDKIHKDTSMSEIVH